MNLWEKQEFLKYYCGKFLNTSSADFSYSVELVQRKPVKQPQNPGSLCHTIYFRVNPPCFLNTFRIFYL